MVYPGMLVHLSWMSEPLPFLSPRAPRIFTQDSWLVCNIVFSKNNKNPNHRQFPNVKGTETPPNASEVIAHKRRGTLGTGAGGCQTYLYSEIMTHVFVFPIHFSCAQRYRGPGRTSQ